MANRLSRYVARIKKLPSSWHAWFFTKLFCSQVKYANTSNIRIIEISHEQALLRLANQKKVQNHIGGIHAIAAALLAESASGIVFGINLTDDKLPLLKSMTVNYQRRMQGNLQAIARITPEQQQQLHSEKGAMDINVMITDETGEQPIECIMTWAWVTKRR